VNEKVTSRTLAWGVTALLASALALVAAYGIVVITLRGHFMWLVVLFLGVFLLSLHTAVVCAERSIHFVLVKRSKDMSIRLWVSCLVVLLIGVTGVLMTPFRVR
jgi:hypothetical protein